MSAAPVTDSSAGRATAQTALAGVAITGETNFAFDPTAVTALNMIGLVPGPVEGATADGNGSFGFPITRVQIDARSRTVVINNSGGISLTKGSTRVVLKNFSINTATSELTADVNGPRLAFSRSISLPREYRSLRVESPSARSQRRSPSGPPTPSTRRSLRRHSIRAWATDFRREA